MPEGSGEIRLPASRYGLWSDHPASASPGNGGGPLFIKLNGLVRCDPDDLDAWLDARKRQSTRSAGELHDCIEGRQRFAQVEGDQIKGISYFDAKPDDGNVYVPVLHPDTEPFDLPKHWRVVRPSYTLVYIAGVPDHVTCTCTVVAKS